MSSPKYDVLEVTFAKYCAIQLEINNTNHSQETALTYDNL